MYGKEIRKNNSGEEFVILDRNGDHCVVQFVKTGYVRAALYHNLNKGKIRDHYIPSVYGKGYDGVYENVPYWRQAKQLWRNVLKRCYSTKDPTGYLHRGTTVDAHWLCFANFLDDLPKLDGFEDWLKGGMSLDKDSKIPGANVYSFETCSFIDLALNKWLGAKTTKEGFISNPLRKSKSGRRFTPCD